MTHDMNETLTPEDQELAMLFRRTSRLMARIYHRHERTDYAQHHVLSLILEKGTIPQAELLEVLDVRSSSLSEILRKLEHNGLITRERNEKDRRSFIVSATELARSKTAESEETAPDAALIFDCLDSEERLQLRIILNKLVTTLQDDPRSGGPGKGHGRHSKFGKGRRKGLGNGPGKGHGRGKGRGPGRGRI